MTESVLKITELIRPIAPELNRNGQQCVVVLATDGLPNSPSTFLRALQDLQKLQVWLVVRVLHRRAVRRRRHLPVHGHLLPLLPGARVPQVAAAPLAARRTVARKVISNITPPLIYLGIAPTAE